MAQILADILAVLGLAAAGFAIIESQRQRNRREKAVTAARAAIERTYGLLLGIKTAAVGPTPSSIEAAINDGLTKINQDRTKLDAL